MQRNFQLWERAWSPVASTVKAAGQRVTSLNVTAAAEFVGPVRSAIASARPVELAEPVHLARDRPTTQYFTYVARCMGIHYIGITSHVERRQREHEEYMERPVEIVATIEVKTREEAEGLETQLALILTHNRGMRSTREREKWKCGWKPWDACMDNQTLTSFLTELLQAYRMHATTLPDLDERPVQPMRSLDAPTQLVGIHVPEPALTAILVLHSPVLPDGDITSVECPRWQLYQELERVLALEKWRAPLPEAGESYIAWSVEQEATFRSIFHRAFPGIMQRLRALTLSEPAKPNRELPGAGLLLQGNSALWVAETRPDPTQIPLIISKFFSERTKRPEPRTSAPRFAVAAREPTYHGHGAYHTPGLRLGRDEDMTLGEREYSKHAVPGRLVFRDTLSGHEFVATHNGFFGVMLNDKPQVHRMLSFLGYSLLQARIPTYSFREVNMAAFHSPPSDEDPFFWAGTWPIDDKPGEGDWAARRLSDDAMRACLRQAEKMMEQPYAPYVPFLLEARSYLTMGLPREALLFAWSVVESEVNRRWSRLLEERGYNTERRRRLGQNDRWSASNKIEVLEMAGALDDRFLKPIHDARKMRNDTFHDKAAPATVDVERLVIVAEEFVGCPSPGASSTTR